MDTAGSASYPMSGFGFSNVEPSHSAFLVCWLVRSLVQLLKSNLFEACDTIADVKIMES